jgi:hypothetical protein
MGTRSHRNRLLIARVTLALMLFAQGVMAWAVCDWLESSPARAVLAAAEVAPCHESGFGAACLAHCLSDRQTVQKVTMDIPAMPPAPVLTLAERLDPAPYGVVAYISDRALGTGPPRRILLQSFQI